MHGLIPPPPILAPAWLTVRHEGGVCKGASVAAGAPFDEWLAYTSAMLRFARNLQWFVGDLLLHGEELYGEDFSQALDGCDYEEESLRACAWVAARIPAVRRRTDLQWSHHREAAALPEAEADALLARAASEGLSVREVRKLAAAQRKPRPRVELKADGVTAEEVIAYAAKLRAAQKAAVAEAEYRDQHEAQTAAIYAGQLDEALAKWHEQGGGK